jgi:hypothetical protein
MRRKPRGHNVFIPCMLYGQTVAGDEWMRQGDVEKVPRRSGARPFAVRMPRGHPRTASAYPENRDDQPRGLAGQPPLNDDATVGVRPPHGFFPTGPSRSLRRGTMTRVQRSGTVMSSSRANVKRILNAASKASSPQERAFLVTMAADEIENSHSPAGLTADGETGTEGPVADSGSLPGPAVGDSPV